MQWCSYVLIFPFGIILSVGMVRGVESLFNTFCIPYSGGKFGELTLLKPLAKESLAINCKY